MRTRRSLAAYLLFIAILSPLCISNSTIPSAHAQGTMITLGQPVTGTLSQANPEDWWGVNIPRGEVNITLSIPRGNSADLAFSFSSFQAGTPLGVSYPTLANVVHNQVGGNESYQFVVPSSDFFLSFPFLVPGPSAIRVYSPSTNYGKTGSVTYTLSVVQVLQFASLTVGSLASFNNVRAGTPVLYTLTGQSFGAYNVTMHANATSPTLWFHITTYEGDLFLPVSDNNLFLGQSSLLIVLSSTTTYLVITPYLNPSPSNKPLRGNVTISYMPLTTISQGQQITGSYSGTPIFYLATNLSPGIYLNLTLSPSIGLAGQLDVYSPSWPGGSDIGSSATPGNGVVQEIQNLALFYWSSYSSSASGGYNAITPTISGPRPDKVLVRVSGSGTGSYTLRLDSAPFPQMLPNTPASLKLSTTNGPYYAFYQARSGPGGYTESLPYTVTNSSVTWNSEIDLDGVYRGLGSFGGTFDPNQLLRGYTNFIVGSASQGDVASWMNIGERNWLYNSNFGAKNATIQVGFGTTYLLTPFVGAAIGPRPVGNSTIRATLSYSFRAPTNIAVGASTTDFISGVNVNMYAITLSAGTTYRVDVSHHSSSEVWEVYDPTTLQTITSTNPFLVPGVSTDPNQPLTSDYFYFTAPATRTYYLAAGMNPGSLISGPNPAGLPEDQYTFTVSVVTTPSTPSTTQLTVTITSPATTTVGQTIKINGTVTNSGSNNANNVIVTMTLPGGLTTNQPLSSTIGTLAPGQSATFSWTLTASSPGATSAAITTSSDNAPQTVKTSTVSISATSQQGPPSSPFLSTTTGVALVTAVVAGIVAFAAGLGLGKKRKQLPVGKGPEGYPPSRVP